MKRIHDNSLDRIKCTFCSFSSIYSFSIKRHMLRAHKNIAIQTPVPVSDSSSCVTTRSRSRISQMPVSDSSGYVTTISQKNKAAQTSRSDVSSFWDMKFLVDCIIVLVLVVIDILLFTSLWFTHLSVLFVTDVFITSFTSYLLCVT